MSAPVHDFRSDTVTRPTQAMRQAMHDAEVGDDVLGDDPTVAILQDEAAALFGREAALFVATGSQGNQIAAHLHTRPGQEVALGANAHSYDWEMAGLAAISGLQARVLSAPRGAIDLDEARAALRPAGGFRPACQLLMVENTHNFLGGAVVPVEHLEALHGIAQERDAKVHLDGARLWHAAVATQTPLADYARTCTSLTVCLSKGLGAPVGSILIGDAAFIAHARDVRKMLGGGMRQVGVLAAPGLVALRDHRERLAEDHDRAQRLADGLSELPSVQLLYGQPESNILFVRFMGHEAKVLEAALAEQGILAFATGPDVIRFVTHYDVGDDGVAAAVACLGTALT